ncbi:GNAT family N-acetyltransferase [Acetobacter persici]|nr:GNAT family N-acetyltransferase [Acetobacter persici]MBS1016298.1 GNAT family N-acetyltransferase [Acetobacter persici]
MSDVSCLETERLLFQAPCREDFEEFAAMWADPDVARYTCGTPETPQAAWGRLLRYRGVWGVMGFGFWSVRDKQTGRFVGTIGFHDAHRDVTPSVMGVPEAGWLHGAMARGLPQKGSAQPAGGWIRTRLTDARCVWCPPAMRPPSALRRNMDLCCLQNRFLWGRKRFCLSVMRQSERFSRKRAGGLNAP